MTHPEEPAASPELVVVGGGILGTSSAVALASRGARVSLVDAGANPASRRSFAWLNSASASTPDYVALRTAGLLHHLAFSRTLGKRSPYGFTGSLSFDGAGGAVAAPVQGDTTNRAATLRSKLSLLQSAGLPAQAVSREVAIEREPDVEWSRAAEPILYAPLEGFVDLDRLLDLQQERFVALGGRFLAGEAQLRAEGDRTAVLVGGSTILPDHVVVAAGGATPSVLAQIGLQLPARTNTGSVLTIPGAGDSVRSILRGPDISVRRTVNGDLLVHSERLDGALAQTDTLPSGRDLTAESVADDPHVWTVLNAVIDAVESLISRRTDRGQVRLSFGQRPIPADGLPVLGPVGPGIHVLFSHSGATLSLVLADLLASQLLDGTDPAILRGFRPERFGLRG